MGFSTVPEARFAEPELSIVELPAAEMGSAGMEMLLARLDNPDAGVEHRVLPARWHEGQSVSKPMVRQAR